MGFKLCCPGVKPETAILSIIDIGCVFNDRKTLLQDSVHAVLHAGLPDLKGYR